MLDNAPGLQVRPPAAAPVFVPGERLGAGKLNRLAGLAAGTIPGIAPPRMVRNAGVVDGAVYECVVVAEDGDFVLCAPGNTVVAGAIPTSGSLRVAKPWLLRRTPFDGKTRNGVSYAYTAVNARTATEAADTDHTENQVIVPAYVAGDTIYATRAVAGGHRVTPTGQDPVMTDYMDLNVDGRSWGAA